MSECLIDRAFLRLAHGLVHYREVTGAAAASERPLLLLHASPNCSRSMVPLMAGCAGRGRVLAPDTPGNGDSERPPAVQPEMADYAAIVDGFLAALDIAEVDVFGSHTGAHIAVELAARFPRRVRSIVVDGLLVLTPSEREDYLANYAPPRVPDEAGSQFHWAWQYVRDQMIFFPHFRKDRGHLRAGGSFDPEFLHHMTLDVLRTLRTYHLAYEAVFRHDLEAALARVACPVRWLDAGHGYLDDGMRLLQAVAPAASVVRVGHAPEDFAAAIEAFNREVP